MTKYIINLWLTFCTVYLTNWVQTIIRGGQESGRAGIKDKIKTIKIKSNF